MRLGVSANKAGQLAVVLEDLILHLIVLGGICFPKIKRSEFRYISDY